MSSAIKLAQEALAKKRAAGEIVQFDPTEKAIKNPRSLAAAITATCWECVGRGTDAAPRKEVAHCTAWSCSLWSLRPWQQIAPATHGVKERQKAIDAFPKTSMQATAARHPTSRSRAIKARCNECIGSLKNIEDCPSNFPRPKQPEPKNYRGCPLWPQRPKRR